MCHWILGRIRDAGVAHPPGHDGAHPAADVPDQGRVLPARQPHPWPTGGRWGTWVPRVTWASTHTFPCLSKWGRGGGSCRSVAPPHQTIGLPTSYLTNRKGRCGTWVACSPTRRTELGTAEGSKRYISNYSGVYNFIFWCLLSGVKLQEFSADVFKSAMARAGQHASTSCTSPLVFLVFNDSWLITLVPNVWYGIFIPWPVFVC